MNTQPIADTNKKKAYEFNPSSSLLKKIEVPQDKYRVGLAYRDGNGVTKDEFLAAEYIQEASDEGVAEADAILKSFVKPLLLDIKCLRGDIGWLRQEKEDLEDEKKEAIAREMELKKQTEEMEKRLNDFKQKNQTLIVDSVRREKENVAKTTKAQEDHKKQIEKLTQKFEKYKKTLEKDKSEVEKDKKEIKKIIFERDVLLQKVSTLEASVKELETKKAILNKKIYEFSGAIPMAMEEERKAKLELETEKNNNRSLSAKIKELELNYAAALKKPKELESTVSQLRSTMTKNEKDSRDQYLACKQQLEQLRNGLSANEKQYVTVCQELSTLKEELILLRNDVLKKNTLINTQAIEITQLTLINARLKKELETVDTKILELAGFLKAEKEKTARLTSSLEQETETRKTKETEAADLQNKMLEQNKMLQLQGDIIGNLSHKVLGLEESIRRMSSQPLSAQTTPYGVQHFVPLTLTYAPTMQAAPYGQYPATFNANMIPSNVISPNMVSQAPPVMYQYTASVQSSRTQTPTASQQTHVQPNSQVTPTSQISQTIQTVPPS